MTDKSTIVVIDPVHSIDYDAVTLVVYHYNKGEGLLRHTHEYSHLTMCTAGKVLIRKEGLEKIIDKSSTPVNLKENEWHEFEALEDGTVLINLFAKGKY